MNSAERQGMQKMSRPSSFKIHPCQFAIQAYKISPRGSDRLSKLHKE